MILPNVTCLQNINLCSLIVRSSPSLHMKQNAVGRLLVHGLFALVRPIVQPTLTCRPPWRVGQYSRLQRQSWVAPGLTEDLSPHQEYLTRDYKPKRNKSIFNLRDKNVFVFQYYFHNCLKENTIQYARNAKSRYKFTFGGNVCLIL